MLARGTRRWCAAGCRGSDDDGAATAASRPTSASPTEPCPDAVNEDNGCIYLGIISDLTQGPFARARPCRSPRPRRRSGSGSTRTAASAATTSTSPKYVRDNKYNPQTHNQVYQEIKGDVLALAQTLGSPTTAAIIADMKANNMVAAPASWTSVWAFEDDILESGANYCVEAMNAVDYAVEETYSPKTRDGRALPR